MRNLIEYYKSIVSFLSNIGIEESVMREERKSIVFKVGDRVKWKYYSMTSNFKAHKDGCVVIGVIGDGKYMIRDYDSTDVNGFVEGIVDGAALLDDREAHRNKVINELGI